MTITKKQESLTKSAMQKTFSGLDHLLLQQNPFKNARIALVTNNAALTSGKEQCRVALLRNGFNIIKLFSPEHGLEAKGADGTCQSNSIDPLTLLPVVSLYGDHLMPTAEDVEGIDMIVFDIPDVGCRFYTYLWTMTYVMEACVLYNKPLVILDRPNPISGDMKKAEGPMLDEKCSSFMGRWNIPIQHSCTLGELATYFSATGKMNIDLSVIQLTGWERGCLPSENNFLFSSRICCRNSAAYGGLVFGIVDSLFHMVRVSTEKGQLQSAWATVRPAVG